MLRSCTLDFHAILAFLYLNIFTHSRITKLIYFFLPSSVSMEGVTTILLLFMDGGGGGGKCDLITLGLSESKNTENKHIC